MPGTGGVYNFTFALVPGMNLVHLVVADLSGASFHDTIRVVVLPDAEPPKIVRTTVPASPMTWVKSTTVVFTVTDNDTVSSVTINGTVATRSGNTYKSAIPLEAGINPIVVVAKDRRGNVSRDSIAVTTILKDRDGNSIRFGRMPDGRMWTLQNLQVKPLASSIRTGATSTCVEGDCSWGRLYSWAMAMDLPATCDTVSCVQTDSLSHQGLCPAGWHVPTHKEWKSLITASAAGTSDSNGLARLRSTSVEGKWYSWEYSTCEPVYRTERDFSGTDTYGFTLLPTHAGAGSGQCGGAGQTLGRFWTATQSDAPRSAALTFSSGFDAGSMVKTDGLVLRCIAN